MKMRFKILMTVATIGLLFVANCAGAGEPQSTPESIIENINKVAKSHLNLNSWTLVAIGIQFNEEKPQKEREYGILYGKYYKNGNPDVYTSVGFLVKFDEEGILTVPPPGKIGADISHSCTGQNCADCNFDLSGFPNIKCKPCTTPAGGEGESICNHSTTMTVGAGLRAIRISQDYPSIIKEANNLLKH
ncbi:MAG: hypothetical protein VXX63_07880 [Bacteroidota bacterium]|nr:hypothetical protein [Bacteroidota bacterium]